VAVGKKKGNSERAERKKGGLAQGSGSRLDSGFLGG
jgi:hypothetical protein